MPVLTEAIRTIRQTCRQLTGTNHRPQALRPDNAHDHCHIANYFIHAGTRRGQPFIPIQIMKLVYFAHAWPPALHNRPLLHREFGA